MGGGFDSGWGPEDFFAFLHITVVLGVWEYGIWRMKINVYMFSFLFVGILYSRKPRIID